MSIRQIQPSGPLISQNVTGNVSTSPFVLANMFAPQATYLVQVGSGLTATFQIMVSQDGINYFDSGAILPSVSGTQKNFIAEYDGGFPFVKLQCTFGSGSGQLTVRGSAKGGA